MHVLMTMLLAMVSRPYQAVSKPTIQAWARLTRGYWRFRLRRAGLQPMAGGAPTLKERETELAAKRKHLHDIFAEAKTEGSNDLDMEKVKLITGTTAEKAVEIKRLNDELTALGKAWEGERNLVLIQMHNAEEQRKAAEPNNPWQHPGEGHSGEPRVELKSLGQLVIESPAFKDYKGGQGPSAELDIFKDPDGREFKTVMSTGAGFAPESIRTGRVVEEALRPIQLLDLIPAGATNQAAVVYMEETTATNAAVERAESAQGALVSDAESALVFTERSSTVRVISTFLPVTREQLEDEPQVQSLVNSRLTFFIRQRLDYQIMQGDGAGANLTGILNTGSIQTKAKGADPVPDAIYKAMTLIRVTGRARPSGIAMHPNDWQDVRLLRTADGIYIWGSPADPGPERIWGLPVAQSDILTENIGLVGDFRAFCQLLIRSGIEVQISDSHASYFIQRLKAIRADMRAAFIVYRPEAFCTVTGI